MKIQNWKICLLIIGIIVLIIGCNGFALQPGFVTILGDEGGQVKILDVRQEEDNSIEIVFSHSVKDVRSKVFYSDSQVNSEGEPLSQIGHKLEKIADDGQEVKYRCTIFDQIEIGKEFKFEGDLKTKSNVNLEFNFLFKGQNHNPAALEITEYKPIYSKSVKKPVPEFIEFKVKKSGNLSGLKILSVGSSKAADYTFPAAEVSAGEIVVVHLRYFQNEADLIRDETKTGVISGGDFACPTARDFWANFGKNPAQRKTNIVLVTTPTDDIQDCLAYVHEKSISNGEIDWTEEQKAMVNKAVNAGFESMVESPVQENVTASVSMSKFNFSGIVWRLCGKKGQRPISMGKANQ
ncbi:MAG: hypothetical protein CR988_00200 [Treponema sp.]|nr:MAG: hypothetical protein CR988_00200 [Treponema sp.]